MDSPQKAIMWKASLWYMYDILIKCGVVTMTQVFIPQQSNVNIYRHMWYIIIINRWGWFIMTSSNGNIFRVTGPLCGEFTGHRWIPLTQWCGALMFTLICTWTKGWANNRNAGEIRRHRARHDVTVMVNIVRKVLRWCFITMPIACLIYTLPAKVWNIPNGQKSVQFRIFYPNITFCNDEKHWTVML